MKAIVFGAGKIARGFIGQLLYLSKADITFCGYRSTAGGSFE